MNDNKQPETIDYTTRLDVWKLTHKIQARLDSLRVIIKNSDDEVDEGMLEDLMTDISYDLQEIANISFGEYQPDSLLASPKAAFNLFTKISEYHLHKEKGE